MMRRLLLLLAVWGCLAACDRTPKAEPAADVLRVAAPAGWLDPAILRQFQQVTGIHAVLTEDPDTPSDMGIVTRDQVASLVADDALQPIDTARVPNAAHVAERFRPRTDSSDDVYSLPLVWETIGLLVRQDLVTDFEPTWAALFDPQRQPASFALLSDDRIMKALALKHLGHSPGATDPQALAAAAALVDQMKASPRIREDPANAAVAVIGSAAAHRAMAGDARLRFVIPEEGSVLRVAVAVVPAAARRVDAAHRFIDYLLDPQIGAQLANYARAATTNDAAMPYISPEDRADPTLYPPPERMEELDLLAD